MQLFVVVGVQAEEGGAAGILEGDGGVGEGEDGWDRRVAWAVWMTEAAV